MSDKKRSEVSYVARLAALGLFSGVINGIFGSGGGVAIVLCLWMLASDKLKDRHNVFANVTAMILPISLSSALVYFSLSTPELSQSIAIGIAALCGGAIGAILLGKLKMKILRIIFATLLLVSGAIMIFR